MVHCARLILATLSQFGLADDAVSLLMTHDVEVRSRERNFLAFMQKYSRTYEHGTVEYDHRRDLFEIRHREVQVWNSQAGRSWTAGINHLSDWTEDEKTNLFGYAGHRVKSSGVARASSQSHSLLQGSKCMGQPCDTRKVGKPDIVIAQRHEWHTPNLALIEDQGSCGSCWAVATAKMIETNYFIGTNRSRSFSAQELTDCSPNPNHCGGTGGCSGATVELAMYYISMRGVSTAEAYQYVGTGSSCHLPPLQQDISEADLAAAVVHTIDSREGLGLSLLNWERLPENQEQPLLEALMQGSVAVSMDASDWSSYNSGIFDSCKQDAVINHAILAIGFGVDPDTGKKFWLIQNSWGPLWGEDGRIRLLRSDDEEQNCGIDSKPEDGTGCDGGPSQVEVCGACGILYDTVIARFGDRL